MNTVILGLGYRMLPIPWFIFKRLLQRASKKTRRILGNLDEEHRRVHHFIVRTLPDLGRPMPPDYIADHLGLDKNRVIRILDELERRLIYVFRSGGQDVVWAYPITVEPTPHRVQYSSGQAIWAA